MWLEAASPLNRVHQHREKRHDDDNGHLGLPVEAEPHDHDRRDADNRQGGDEIADGQQPTLEEGRTVDEDGDDEAEAAAEHITRQHRFEESLAEIRPKDRQGCEKAG